MWVCLFRHLYHLNITMSYCTREIIVVYGTVDEDVTHLSCDLQDQLVTTSYRSLFFGVPYVRNGNHGILHIVKMTPSENRLTPPLLANDDYRINVDGESVTIRTGNDVMMLSILANAACHTDTNAGIDFDHVHGINLTFTCYPKRFDWSCGSTLDWDTGYCRVLKENLCQIERFDGDVCIHATTRTSIRCPSTIS